MKTEGRTATVGARLYRLVGAFMLVAVITGTISYQTLSRVKVNGPIYTGIAQQKDLLGDILPPPMYILETYMTVLQVLGEPDPAAQKTDLEKLQSLKRDFAERTEFWSKALPDSPVKRTLLEDAHQPAAAFFETLETDFLPAVQKQDKAAATAIADGKLKSEYLEHRQAIDHAVALATQNSERLEGTAAKEVQQRTVLMVGALLAGLLLIGVYSMEMARRLIGLVHSMADHLAEGSGQVSSAASQVSAASQTLAEGSSEQASSLEETSSSLEEMSSMTKRNADNARKANELAKEARAAADQGVSDMHTMAAAMEAIKVSSDDIAKIIKTIDEIAFQTNILALNAAVEAARAGEAGMGFAVVADEVRNLAQRSAQAAKETAGKIEGAIARTGQGVSITTQVEAALNEIVTKVRQVDELVTEVAGATREQTEGIAQINVAVGQMDKITQSNAATAEESAAAAEELHSQAEVVKQSVAELLQLVGGRSKSMAHSPMGARRRSAPVPVAKPAAKWATSSGRNGSSDGHGYAGPEAVAPATRREEIPFEGEFKDF